MVPVPANVLPPLSLAGVSLSMRPSVYIMPGGRSADAVHVHRHLGVLQCTGVNAQFVRMGIWLRQTDGTGRILGTGHVLFDFLLILVRTLAHRYRGLTRHDLHLRIGPTPDGLRVDDRVPGTPDAFTVVSSSLPESLYVVTPVPVMSITAPSSTLPSTSWVGPGISMTYGLGSSRITTPSNTANAPTKWRFGRAAA